MYQPDSVRGKSAAGLLLPCLLLLLSGLMAGCAGTPALPSQNPEDATHIALPLLSGWYEGKPVYYIVTETNDAGMAAAMGANLTPRLSQALPPSPRPPGFSTVLEKVYVFDKGEQGSVFQSIPQPLGARSADKAYSPLWLKVNVRWLPGKAPKPLHSEEAVLAAAEQGSLELQATGVVINCPVVAVDSVGALPGSHLLRWPPDSGSVFQ